jgi:pseudouridine-5'-phosphate glycosidase
VQVNKLLEVALAIDAEIQEWMNKKGDEGIALDRIIMSHSYPVPESQQTSKKIRNYHDIRLFRSR